MKKRIFVAQYADLHNNNPQVLNTRALLSRFSDERYEWLVPHFGIPDPALAAHPDVKLIKLWPWRFWQLHKCLLYQAKVDAIFYPGPYWFDDWGLRLRRLCRRRVPIIATLEGLAGNDAWAREYSAWAGHPVYCQYVEPGLLARIDRIKKEADHVIAISPFLARMGAQRYGDKFSEIPLGINGEVFHARARVEPERFRVVGVGSFQSRKRPEIFIEFAEKFPGCDFIWYGEGEKRQVLINQAQKRRLENVKYPGPVANSDLGDIFRQSNLFVLPAISEGVPKVSQEAAACGLPVVCFGFYEAPSVVDGENGFVVWDDDALFARAGELIADAHLARRMGERGAEMAKEWDWRLVASRWEYKVRDFVN